MAFFNRSEGQQIGKLFEKLSLPINAKEKITRIKSWLKEQEKSGRSNPLEALRREFPKLRENTFSSEDNLLDYLSNSLNRERLLSQLTPEQKAELSQIQPAITEEAGAQPVGQEAQAAEAPQAVPPTTGQATGMPSMPTADYTPPARQAKYVVVMPEKTPEKAEAPETMEGQGEKPQATPGEQQETMAPKTEASHGQPPNLPSQAAPATSSFQTEKPHKGPAQLQTGWRSSVKTGLSNFGIFFKKASTKLGQGLMAFARPAAGLAGGMAGSGIRSIGGSLGRVPNIFGGGLNPMSGGRRAIGNIGSSLGKVGKNRLLLVLLLMMLLGMIVGIFFASNPTGQPVSTAPITGGGSTTNCDFASFNILKGDAVDDTTLQKYIARALGTGKVKTDEQKSLLASRAKYIRDQAQAAGLNPAIFLGYWESKSAFSDYTYPGVRPGMDLGCAPLDTNLKTFEDDVFCAIGKSQINNSRTSQCAISKDINSAGCQAITWQQAEGVKLPITTLKDFLDSYGSKNADAGNARSDAIVKQTIADLGLASCAGSPYTTPAGCVASKTVVPALNEYDYPSIQNKCEQYGSSAWPMTCGPTSGAMILQSIGINSSIEKVANDWLKDGAWSNTAGFYGASLIATALNKEYPGQIQAKASTVKNASAVRTLIEQTKNAVMVSTYYNNTAVNEGLDKQAINGPSSKIGDCSLVPRVIGDTNGGVSLTYSKDRTPGHMVVVYQICDDRVFINDPILAEQYSIPVNQFNTAVGLPGRGEAISITSLTPSSTQAEFIRPTSGTITTCWGNIKFPNSEKAPHKGIDIGNVERTQVYAVGDGIVELAAWDGTGEMGYYIVINHENGLRTFYMHLTPQFEVSVGQQVNKGQLIGYMDHSGKSYGDHLHFAIKKEGVEKINPRSLGYVDPAPYLGITCQEGGSF